MVRMSGVPIGLVSFGSHRVRGTPGSEVYGRPATRRQVVVLNDQELSPRLAKALATDVRVDGVADLEVRSACRAARRPVESLRATEDAYRVLDERSDRPDRLISGQGGRRR